MEIFGAKISNGFWNADFIKNNERTPLKRKQSWEYLMGNEYWLSNTRIVIFADQVFMVSRI